MKPARGDKLSLHIDRLSVGGRGVARAQDLVIFVPDVCPGEDIEAQITFVKKNFAEARLLKVNKPSASRVEPPCPVAGICGGCNWQHLSYAEQLTWKRELVRESLKKFSGFDVSEENLVRPTIASPKELRYRNRVQFHYDNGRVGYFKRGSHELIGIDDCPIAEDEIAAQIPELRSIKGQGRVEVFNAEDGTTHSRMAQKTDTNEHDDEHFAFSQVNTQQNRNLVAMVVAAFMKQVPTIIFDLYAGSGNFTFPIKKAFPSAKITAVELNKESVERALAREQDIRWVQSDVGAFLSSEKLPAGAGVLIDPPRAGCDPLVTAQLASAPLAFLVYVSCHPVTLSRDLKAFRENGWRLQLVQPFDMFPQTDHVETLVVMTRPSSAQP